VVTAQPPQPLFTWKRTETVADTDFTFTSPGAEELVIHLPGWEAFRRAHGQRAASALLVLASVSRLHRPSGRRIVAGSKAYLGELIGAGDEGWSRVAAGKVIDSLVEAGLLTRVEGVGRGRGRGSSPTVYLLGDAVAGAPAGHDELPDDVATTLLRVFAGGTSNDGASHPRASAGKAVQRGDTPTAGIAAGQGAERRRDVLPSDTHHGMDDGSHHPSMAAAADVERDPEVEAWLLEQLRRFGWTTKPSPAVLVALTDPAWLAAHLVAVAAEGATGALGNPGAVLRTRIESRADPAGWRPGHIAVPVGSGGVRVLPAAAGESGRAPAIITTADILAAIEEVGEDDIGAGLLVQEEIRNELAGRDFPDPADRSRAYHAAALRALAARGRTVQPGHARNGGAPVGGAR
jgi:hypothetical protein